MAAAALVAVVVVVVMVEVVVLAVEVVPSTPDQGLRVWGLGFTGLGL